MEKASQKQKTPTSHKQIPPRLRKYLKWAILPSYVLLLISICLIGEKTFLWKYELTEIPAILTSITTSLISIIATLGIPLLLKAMLEKKWEFKERAKKILDQGYLAIIIAFASLIIITFNITLPPHDPFKGLFKQFEAHYPNLLSINEELDTLKPLAKFNHTDDFRILALMTSERENREKWNSSEWSIFITKMQPNEHSQSQRIRSWGLLKHGQGLLKLRRYTEAIQDFNTNINTPNTSKFILYECWMGIGFIKRLKGNYEEAFAAWETANNYFESPKALQNMAIYYGVFKKNHPKDIECIEKAKNLYADYLEKYNIPPREMATLRLNYAQAYHDYADTITSNTMSAEVGVTLRQAMYNKAWDALNDAISYDAAYLPIYWTGIQFANSEKKFNIARAEISIAISILNNPISYRLDQDYRQLGPEYTSWLIISTYYQDEKRRPTDTHLQYIKDSIIGLKDAPYVRLKDILQQTSQIGFTTEECKILLERMNSEKYLEKFSTYL